MRNITLSLLLISAALTAQAQGPHVGVKAGLNVSNLYAGEVNDYNARLGFNAGVMGRTSTDAPFGLQVELLYSTKGNNTRYTGVFGLVDQEVQFDLNYLELPVLACFRFAENALELQVGAYGAYLLSSNVSTSGDLGNGSEPVDLDNLASIDAGLAGGLAFNAGPAQLGARYSLGLVQVADSDGAELLLGDAKNSCLQVFVAFGIPGE
ncbi:MAG: PorT family protein [Flavobacteriales bacterium]|nr:PorT family protein [Flavobacteriales bacterium]